MKKRRKNKISLIILFLLAFFVLGVNSSSAATPEKEKECEIDADCYGSRAWELKEREFLSCNNGTCIKAEYTNNKYKESKDKTKERLSGSYKDIMAPSGQGEYYDLVNYQGEGEKKLAETVFNVINIIRGILVFFAIVWLVYNAIKVITAGDDEKIITEFKSAIKWVSIALIISVVVFDLPKFFYHFDINNPSKEAGDILATRESAIAAGIEGFGFIMKLVEILYYLTATLAILFIVVTGIRMMAAGGDTSKVDKQKINMKYITVGLFVTLLSEPIVKFGLFKRQGDGSFNMDANQLTTEIMGFLNYSLMFTAAILLSSTVFSGLMMIVEIGKEELLQKAKKAFINNLIGFILIFCSLAIVQTIIAAYSGDTSGLNLDVGISF